MLSQLWQDALHEGPVCQYCTTFLIKEKTDGGGDNDGGGGGVNKMSEVT
jgi:hypothetical protein